MAGHAQLHPYLKSFDEIKRTINRMKIYLDMHFESIPDDEKEGILIMIEKLDAAVNYIPEKYQVSRYKQFNKKD